MWLLFFACNAPDPVDTDVVDTDVVDTDRPDTDVDTDVVDTDDEPLETTVIALSPAVGDVPNPRRGFYRAVDLLDERDLSWVRDEGWTLVHAFVRLDAYRDADLDAALLDDLDAGLEAAREAGLTVVLRFGYNAGPYPDSEPDASKARILRHIEQLAPVLAEHEGTVAFVQAGFVGAWGEWHTSTNGLLDDPDDGREIVEALLAATGRPVLVRTPAIKAARWSGTVDASNAWTDAAVARIGHHNDCFLASDTDFGTWSGDVEAAKDRVAAETLYVPIGGETCAPNPPRSACAAAMAEMERLHWSHLNLDYHPDVIDGWRDGGCFDTIAARLGPRIVVRDVETALVVPEGADLPLRVRLVNEGWAPIYDRYDVSVVVGSEEIGIDVDPRGWAPGQEVTLDLLLEMPVGIAVGEVELGLALRDPLSADPRRAYRFANAGTWDDAGWNRLVTIEVVP